MRIFSLRLLLASLLPLAAPPPAAAQSALAPPSAKTGKTTQSILAGWRFHQVGQAHWAPATVPGCVHTDMVASKQIEDPLYRDNELRQQWIGKTDWDYETTFDVAPTAWHRQHLELVFKGLDTYVVSDHVAATPATLQVRLLDFGGKVLYKQTAALQIEPLTSKAYLAIPKAKLLKGQDPKQVVLSCALQAGGTTLSTNTHYFALPKEMALPKARISATWQPATDSTYQVTLKSKTLAREVWLSLAQGDGFFGNNFFDLLPGETKVLTFKSEGATSAAQLRKQLVVRTLPDAF